jgi:hypothetical protein
MDDAVVRPSRHPRRQRMCTVAVASADGTYVTTLRRRGRGVDLLEGGEGRLLDRLIRVAATLRLRAG